MHMGIQPAVQPLHAVHGAQADNQPLFLKQLQVAVDRGKRDIRVLLLEAVIELLRGRMGLRLAKTGKNRISFAKLLCAVFLRGSS